MNSISYSRACYVHCLKQYHIRGIQLCTKYSSHAQSESLHRKFIGVQNKVHDFMKWYEHMTGIDEIRTSQSKVIEAQERFAAAQEKRREVTLELNDVKNKIKDLQEELSTIPRGEEKYITLITKEHKLLKEEIRLTDKFNLYEREERELFTTLTTSVKDSHEKERIQANKTKYFSIIGSVLGALIGIVGSTINNRSKINEIKQLVTKSTEESKQDIMAICKQLEITSKNPPGPSSNTELAQQLQIMTKKLDMLSSSLIKTQSLENAVSHLEKKLNSTLQNVQETVRNERLTNESDVSDFERRFPHLAKYKDDISYAVVSCFSVYFLYKLFFP